MYGEVQERVCFEVIRLVVSKLVVGEWGGLGRGLVVVREMGG